MEMKTKAELIPEKEEGVTKKMYEEGTVVKGPGEAIYIIGGKGEKRVIPDLFTYVKLGISEDEIVHLSEKALDDIPEGAPIPKIEPRSVTPKAKARLAEVVKRLE